MKVPMMYLTIWIPYWESLDSVRRAHNDLEAVALGFFALLVVFELLAHLSSEDKKRETILEKIAICFFAVAVLAEIVAYPYGRRNDTLSEQIIGSLDAKARNASTNASNALTKAGEADTKAEAANTASSKAQEKADTASRVSDNAVGRANAIIDALRQPRLTDDDQQALVARLKACPHHNNRVVILSSGLNSFLVPIMLALQKAGFNAVEPKPVLNMFEGTHVSGTLGEGITAGCIQEAIGKTGKIALEGLLGFNDPPGSPITIWLGINPIGPLPDTVKPINKKQHNARQRGHGKGSGET